MRKSFLITLFAVFTAIVPIYAIKAPITIQGKIAGLKGRTVVLSDINGTTIIAQAKGGKLDTFILKATLEIGDGRLYIINVSTMDNTNTQSAISNYLFIDASKIVVNGQIANNRLKVLSVNPSLTMKEYLKLKKENPQENIYAAMLANYKTQMKAYDANEQGSLEKCQEAILQLQRERDVICDSYVQMIPFYPNSNALLATIYSYCDINNAKGCEEWLDKFASSMRSNYYAQKIIKKANYQKNSEVGKQAPEFSLYDQNGQIVKLSSLRGQNVLLYIWSTWGSSTAKEFATLKEMSSRYQGKNLKILGICTLSNKMTWQNVMSMQQFDFAQLFDSGNVMPVRYANNSMPFTILINTDGIITHRGLRGGEIVKAIDALNL